MVMGGPIRPWWMVEEAEKTSQPLKERGIPGAQDATNQGIASLFSLPVIADMVAPVGIYEDGSVGLAWPKLAAGIGDAAVRGYEQSQTALPPINDDEAWAEKSRDFFDAASLAPIGGFGVGLSGGMVDNALGSAGGKLTQSATDLPMDLASRMQRAREMGFDTETPLYHGTRRDFDEFMQPQKYSQYGPGVYTARNADEASRYAMLGDNPDGARVLPLYAKQGQYATGDQIDRLAGEIAQAGKATRRADAYELAVKQLMDEGYLGVDTAGGYRSIFDPRNIRSVNAAFDPAKSDSANLLAANAKSGAAVPLAIDAAESQAPQGIRAYRGASDGTADIPRADQFWAAKDPQIADSYAFAGGTLPSVAPVDMRFSNPLTVDARGAMYDAIPFEGDRLFSEDLFKRAKELGHDGLIVRNVRDDVGGAGGPSDIYAATRPGTVFSATTGKQLYANAPTGAAIPAGMEASQQDDEYPFNLYPPIRPLP